MEGLAIPVNEAAVIADSVGDWVEYAMNEREVAFVGLALFELPAESPMGSRLDAALVEEWLLTSSDLGRQ